MTPNPQQDLNLPAHVSGIDRLNNKQLAGLLFAAFTFLCATCSIVVLLLFNLLHWLNNPLGWIAGILLGVVIAVVIVIVTALVAITSSKKIDDYEGPV